MLYFVVKASIIALTSGVFLMVSIIKLFMMTYRRLSLCPRHFVLPCLQHSTDQGDSIRRRSLFAVSVHPGQSRLVHPTFSVAGFGFLNHLHPFSPLANRCNNIG